MLVPPVTESHSFHQITEKTTATPGDYMDHIQDRSDRRLNFFWMGTQFFQPVWELQKMIHSARVENKIHDVVLLLEHHPVYTFGKNANRDHLLPSHSADAEIVSIDRGGDVTFHGPGQLVVYPILDLRDYRKSVSWYMRNLETVVIRTLKEFGLNGGVKDGMTGVWIDDEKICAMGVRLSRWVTMHGLALNLDIDLDYFNGIIPCGIFEYGVTSIREQSVWQVQMPELINIFVKKFEEVFQPLQAKIEEL